MKRIVSNLVIAALVAGIAVPAQARLPKEDFENLNLGAACLMLGLVGAGYAAHYGLTCSPRTPDINGEKSRTLCSIIRFIEENKMDMAIAKINELQDQNLQGRVTAIINNGQDSNEVKIANIRFLQHQYYNASNNTLPGVFSAYCGIALGFCGLYKLGKVIWNSSRS